MEFDSFITHNIDLYMGKPKSGKTIIAGSYPKPLLYCAVGNDGGGRVLQAKYPADCRNGNIKVKNLRNDPIMNGRIAKTSIEKCAELLRDLRKEGNPFKTVVFDTLGSFQEDYKQYLIFNKRGSNLSQQEWGTVADMMMSMKDNMKKYSEESGTIIVWITHTREYELYETSGLAKEMRIIPDVTINTGVKFMKDASNIFYCCRKTVEEPNGTKDTKFLTYVGPNPVMDTGTRDLILEHGCFVENFSYDKFQDMIAKQQIDAADVVVQENNNKENEVENND